MDHLIRINDQLPAWESYPESTEPWLLKHHEEMNSILDSFEKLVKEKKDAIEKIL